MVILLETAVGLGWELGGSCFLLEGEVLTDVHPPTHTTLHHVWAVRFLSLVSRFGMLPSVVDCRW